MAQLLTDRRDIDFVLYEQLDTSDVLQNKKFAGFNRKTLDLIINEARNFALKELLPTNTDGDRIGARFVDGQVHLPESFHRPFNLLREGEWTSLTEDPDYGGQGMPFCAARAVSEYMIGANYGLVNYGTMGHGTGKMVELYGTEVQKQLFLKKLYTAEWGGTMLLTEPEAGSDVGALTTTAVPNEDGTYSLTGTKIFITNGDHDLSENIIHPVLARIEGAPAGTKGISIFLVPKIWVHPDGSLGDPNDIVCTGIEEKLGIHASVTCTMTMGGKGNCRGLLLGQENQGMRVMFTMMNEARLGVGFQGFVYGSVAYQYALNYARERIQGRDLSAGKDPNASPVPIIQHPDVRRMLMWMKSHVDGMRSFIYFVDGCLEKIDLAESEDQRDYYQGLSDFFTPLVKAYAATRGFEVCVQAMQVYGGYGYTQEYPIEQLMRDAKITSIYEGTDGIQAMDLLGRKMGMHNGRLFKDFIDLVQEAIDAARRLSPVAALANEMQDAITQLMATAQKLGQTMTTADFKNAFAHAHPFMMATGDVIMAWMLLWRATLAAQKLDQGVAKKDLEFYGAQLKTAEFFIHSVLPAACGQLKAMQNVNSAAVEISDAGFGA